MSWKINGASIGFTGAFLVQEKFKHDLPSRKFITSKIDDP